MHNTSDAWLYPLAFAANATRQAGNRTWITCGGVNTHPRSCEALLGHGRGTSHCSWLTHPTPPILRGTTWPCRTPYSTRAAHSLWEAEIMGPLPSCTHSPRLPHFSHTSGSCYTDRVWDKEFLELKSLGVCTCNIFFGLTPASLRGDAAVSYGADACNTPNYVNTVLMVFALIAVYVASSA